MTAEEMVKTLLKEFWCFDTFTEVNKDFADRVAVKNAYKFTQFILDSDPDCDQILFAFNQNKLGVDKDFWESVDAILKSKLDKANKLDYENTRPKKNVS